MLGEFPNVPYTCYVQFYCSKPQLVYVLAQNAARIFNVQVVVPQLCAHLTIELYHTTDFFSTWN